MQENTQISQNIRVEDGDGHLPFSAVWKPKTLNVSQLGSNLHVAFESAPASFGFHFYYLYYKLRQDGPFRMQRCKPVSHTSRRGFFTLSGDETMPFGVASILSLTFKFFFFFFLFYSGFEPTQNYVHPSGRHSGNLHSGGT